MILAAGRGERLKPLTDRIPKPLIEVGGQPLIEHHLQALSRAGVSEVVINISWLGEQIRSHLGDGSRWNLSIAYSPEPPGALETAGGIRRALPLLDSECFLVISGDVLTDFDFGYLVGRRPSGLAHLVMVDNPPHHQHGDFNLAPDGALQIEGMPRLTYSGIGIFHSNLFVDVDPEVPMPLRPLLEQAIGRRQLSGEHYRGKWMDIGTLERLHVARQLN